MTALSRERFRLIATPVASTQAAFARDVAAGMKAVPKRLLCRYFYDEEGGRLFDAICDLPEYYLTRAERGILRVHAAEIAARFPGETTLFELGSGSAAKTRLLLEAFLAGRSGQHYVPVDVSTSVLEESSQALLRDFPTLRITAIVAEYYEALRYLEELSGQPKLILWLGSNVGNLERTDAAAFLRRLRGAMTAADRLLIGIDLRKERAVLEPAYNDAQGVTGKFNLNLLARINRELDGRFDLAKFRHRAVYEEEAGRIKMTLVSTAAQRVTIGGLGMEVDFAAAEPIHTENSYKYSLAEIDALGQSSGLSTERRWLDPEGRFSLNLFAARA